VFEEEEMERRLNSHSPRTIGVEEEEEENERAAGSLKQGRIQGKKSKK
jgi:hypothetical protein